MSTQELRDYIDKQQKEGKSRPEIVKALLANGWQQADVDLAFASLANGVPLPPAGQMSSQPSGLKPFGDLFRESWNIFRQKFWSLVAVAVIPWAFIIASVIIAVGSSSLRSLTTDPISAIDDLYNHIATLGIIWTIVVVIMFMLITLSNLALLRLITNGDGTAGVSEAYAFAWKNFGRGLWLQVLVGTATYGGMALFGIPGIIASLALMFSLYVMVVEGASGFKAMIRSHALVYHRWWAIFFNLFILGLIGGGIQMVLWLPALFTLGIVFAVYALVWQIFMAIFVNQLYQSAKATAGPQDFSHKKIQYQIYAVIGVLVIVAYAVLMVVSFSSGITPRTININLNNSNWNSEYIPEQ